MNKATILNFIISSILTLSIGLFTGYSVGFSEANTQAFPELKPVPELNPGIGTIKLLKEENGILHGEIEGQKVRIAYGPEDIKDIEVGEKFEIPIKNIQLRRFYSAQDFPEGMAFASSKTGKYYYHIFDPRALRITPNNRLYFASEQEAQEAGFLPPK